MQMDSKEESVNASHNTLKKLVKKSNLPLVKEKTEELNEIDAILGGKGLHYLDEESQSDDSVSGKNLAEDEDSDLIEPNLHSSQMQANPNLFQLEERERFCFLDSRIVLQLSLLHPLF